jgi:hypothetical protein
MHWQRLADGRGIAVVMVDNGPYVWEFTDSNSPAVPYNPKKFGEGPTAVPLPPADREDPVCFAISPDGKTLYAVKVWGVSSGAEVRVIAKALDSWIEALALSPDGRRMLSGSQDLTALLWDGSFASAVPSTDAAPQPEALLDRLVAGLDADAQPQRDKAMRELDALGESAVAGLTLRAARISSPEARQRLGKLLAKYDSAAPTLDRLREERALELLEQMNTPDARALLADLAKGAPGARLTRAATDSLRRAKLIAN